MSRSALAQALTLVQQVLSSNHDEASEDEQEAPLIAVSISFVQGEKDYMSPFSVSTGHKAFVALRFSAWDTNKQEVIYIYIYIYIYIHP